MTKRPAVPAFVWVSVACSILVAACQLMPAKKTSSPGGGGAKTTPAVTATDAPKEAPAPTPEPAALKPTLAPVPERPEVAAPPKRPPVVRSAPPKARTK